VGVGAKNVSNETYTAFCKFIAHAFDEPLDKLHFRADAPLEFRVDSFFFKTYCRIHSSTKERPSRVEQGLDCVFEDSCPRE